MANFRCRFTLQRPENQMSRLPHCSSLIATIYSTTTTTIPWSARPTWTPRHFSFVANRAMLESITFFNFNFFRSSLSFIQAPRVSNSFWWKIYMYQCDRIIIVFLFDSKCSSMFLSQENVSHFYSFLIIRELCIVPELGNSYVDRNRIFFRSLDNDIIKKTRNEIVYFDSGSHVYNRTCLISFHRNTEASCLRYG